MSLAPALVQACKKPHMGVSGAPSGVGLRTLRRQLSHPMWLQDFSSPDFSGHCEIDKTVMFAFSLDMDVW